MDHHLRMTYDPESDAAYIYVTDPIEAGGAASTSVLDRYTENASVIVDFDENNRLLGIEFLGVSNLLRPEAIPKTDGQTSG